MPDSHVQAPAHKGHRPGYKKQLAAAENLRGRKAEAFVAPHTILDATPRGQREKVAEALIECANQPEVCMDGLNNEADRSGWLFRGTSTQSKANAKLQSHQHLADIAHAEEQKGLAAAGAREEAASARYQLATKSSASPKTRTTIAP